MTHPDRAVWAQSEVLDPDFASIFDDAEPVAIAPGLFVLPCHGVRDDDGECVIFRQRGAD